MDTPNQPVKPRRLDFGDHGFLNLHEGPRLGVPANGLFVDREILPALIAHLKTLNSEKASRELSLAITKLEEGQLWLAELERNRMNIQGSQRVLGQGVNIPEVTTHNG